MGPTSLAGRARAWAHRLLHPFPGFPFLNGHVFSPADALAERISQDSTEAVFTLPAAKPVVSALVRCFEDPEAERALKKEFLRVYEHRLRAVALKADPPALHGLDDLDPGPLSHPLDRAALAALKSHRPDLDVPLEIGALAGLQHRLTALVAGLGMLASTIAMFFKHGRMRVEPVSYQLASPNFGPPAYWRPLVQAAHDIGVWRPDSMAFVLEDDSIASNFRDGEIPAVEVATMAVPLGPWLYRVIFPSLLLACRVFAILLNPRLEPREVELCARALNLAGRSAKIWRIAFNVHSRWYLDTEDNSSLHLLRAIIRRKFGGGVVRWLYTQNESPGIFLSYLGYDVFLSGGPLQYHHYGHSWYPGVRNLSVGQTRIDRRLKDDVHVAKEYRDIINSRLQAGDRLAVYFGGNLDVGFERPMMECLDRFLNAFADRPGWFVVVKPKGSDRFYDLCQSKGRYERLETASNLLKVRYTEGRKERCASGWLIDRMAAGLTIPGSVQFEALATGRVMFAYWPTIQQTETRRVLKEAGLVFDDLDRLEASLGAFRDDPDGFVYPVAWIRDNFDVFCDDRAYERVAEVLFGNEGSSRSDLK